MFIFSQPSKRAEKRRRQAIHKALQAQQKGKGNVDEVKLGGVRNQNSVSFSLTFMSYFCFG